MIVNYCLCENKWFKSIGRTNSTAVRENRFSWHHEGALIVPPNPLKPLEQHQTIWYRGVEGVQRDSGIVLSVTVSNKYAINRRYEAEHR